MFKTHTKVLMPFFDYNSSPRLDWTVLVVQLKTCTVSFLFNLVVPSLLEAVCRLLGAMFRLLDSVSRLVDAVSMLLKAVSRLCTGR